MWRCRHTVTQKCSIPSLEEYTKSSPEVSSILSFLLPGVSGQSSSKLLHLSFSSWVPTPEGLCSEGKKAEVNISSYPVTPVTG